MDHIKLIILETSDLHGAILPIQYSSNTPANIGLAKLASYMKKIRSENEHVLVIDNGDFMQGTPLASYYFRMLRQKVHPMIIGMNKLQYDAAVLGNHEFNYGLDTLTKVAADATFPFLSCNILSGETGKPFFGTPYVIKTFSSGIKAAVLGVTTHYIPNWEKPSHIEGLIFEDAVTATSNWVKHIREVEQPDIMIVSYHGGFEVDLATGKRIEPFEKGENQAYRLCMEVEGIDVLLTGHQHRQEQQIINGVAVVQPGYKGQAIGQVTAEFVKENQQYKLQQTFPETIQTVDLTADQSLMNLIEPYEQGTQKWLDEVLGTVEGDMRIHDPFQARLAEHPMIELIHKVQMDAAHVDISSTALFHNDSPGLPSHITMRSIVSNYIYPNSLMVIEVTGEDIKQALERSASYFTLIGDEPAVSADFSRPKPQHYNYDMWEGIEYTIDLRRSPGNRIIQAMYQGEPLNTHQRYKVVMNNYRAGGGGDYLMFKGKKVIKEIQTDMTELLAAYIRKRRTIKAEVNNNWNVIIPSV
ncbi:bifunctional UDP-sugar hydrolase/5'-nucleotidase [Bacillus sp. REN10]|uniref:bifunctional metallophosphatase/5'-nucleotidase n=1 Tax=Bacillus sp. REN10 TaxID=2782541 RepID=UPI00193B345F|nr:bifunctional UDP-sugar hydrolase/5'-nucleotidase [Bacillus sp. REN10]